MVPIYIEGELTRIEKWHRHWRQRRAGSRNKKRKLQPTQTVTHTNSNQADQTARLAPLAPCLRCYSWAARRARHTYRDWLLCLCFVPQLFRFKPQQTTLGIRTETRGDSHKCIEDEDWGGNWDLFETPIGKGQVTKCLDLSLITFTHSITVKSWREKV